jgi:hypothetical protein
MQSRFPVLAYTRIGGLLGPIAVKMGQGKFMACSNRLWTRNAAKATCKSFKLQDGIPVTHHCKMPFELSLVRPENRTFHKVQLLHFSLSTAAPTLFNVVHQSENLLSFKSKMSLDDWNSIEVEVLVDLTSLGQWERRYYK